VLTEKSLAELIEKRDEAGYHLRKIDNSADACR